MYDKILVPTDGSEGTEAAMYHAFELAEQYDAELHVLYVLDTRSMTGNPAGDYIASDWTGEQRDAAERALNTVVERAPDNVETVSIERSGIPSTEIVNYADAANIELIVMGTHGRTGLERYLIGSVAEKVVRQSRIPVMTVRLGEKGLSQSEE